MGNSDNQPSVFDMIEAIKTEFEGVDTPVSAEHVAALYGVLAAQSDAMLALYALTMKANPRNIFTDERIAADKALQEQVGVLQDALIGLAKSYGKTEGEG